MYFLKAAGIGSSILILIALVIALVKQLITFIGFITFAIKAIIFLAFIALILGVGIIVFRSWSGRKRQKDNS